jgi:ParB family chromosome partitioning protein
LTFAHGRALLETEDTNEQRLLAQKVITKNLSVRELENLLKRKRPRVSMYKGKSTLDNEPYLAVLQDELQQALSTKVRIIKRKKRGHIVVEFYSDEDLKRISRRIKGAAE